MVFSSLIFLFFFLPAVLFCYYIVPTRFIRARNMVLLLFSLFFYFYGEPKLIIMLVLSILMNYLFGLSMRSRYRKSLLIFCITANLTLLGVFKYLNFFIRTADGLLGLNIQLTSIVMPIGISFYTFQALSYVIDVYRREVPPQHDPFSLALYVSMFPQLIAGPIVRYHDVNEQLADGIFAYQPAELSTAAAWLGAIGYTLQIYFDFSGYSDMAIGLGKMFGFTFLENFNYPYISRSVTEFWRRWHISLSTWFRDYVYIPLGGNRCSPARHICNLLVVWTLTGFWHGANWTFMAWGLYFGILLILEKKFLSRLIERLPMILRHVYALFFIIIGWVFFRSDSMNLAMQYIGRMFSSNVPVNGFVTEYLIRFWPYLLFGVVLSAPVFPRLTNTRAWRVLEIPILGILGLLCVMSLLASSYNPFIYFRF